MEDTSSVFPYEWRLYKAWTLSLESTASGAELVHSGFLMTGSLSEFPVGRSDYRDGSDFSVWLRGRKIG